MSNEIVNKELGMVTAYAYAVAGGYEGTEEEFEQLLGSASIILDNFENFSVTVETLRAGSAATASYADGVLNLGIPKGDKGDKGDQGETGETGATPDLSIGTVTTLNAGDDATATIGGTAEEPILNLGIPKGPSGNTGVTAELFSASKAYSAGDFVIYNDALYTFTADHAAGAWTGSDATQTTAGGEISQLKEDFNAVDVEYYSRITERQIDISAYLISDRLVYIANNVINITPNSTYKYYDVPTDGFSDIKAVGFSQSNVKSVIFADNNNNLIDYYPKNNVPAPGAEITVECAVPSGATKVLLIGQRSTNVALYKPVDEFIASDELRDAVEGGSPLGNLVSGTTYEIDADDFASTVNLNGSNNGSFQILGLDLNGSRFKAVGDDICPVYLSDVGYVGANHGYSLAYKYTYSEPHGLTTADIGKTYTPTGSSVTYVLMQVPSTTEIVVSRYTPSHWTKLYPNVAGNVLDFGTGALTPASKAAQQLYPSIKNKSIEIVENNAKTFTVCESYDIIDIGSGVDELIANVGNNDNESFCTLSDGVALTVRNTYKFQPNGSLTIYQNLKVSNNSAVVAWYGGAQSGAFATTDYFAISQTEYKELTASTSTTTPFTRDTWDDSTKPPMVYIQADSANLTKAFLICSIVNNRNALIANSAGQIYGSTRKMYPYAINPEVASEEGEVYNIISCRIPIIANQIDSEIKIVGYTKVYDDYYLFVSPMSAVNKAIKLPSVLCNKKAEIVMSDGVTCETENVIDCIDVRCSGAGHLVVKLSN